jgi:outer membrane protein
MTHITMKRLLPLSIALGLAFAAPVRAQSLVDLYESARVFDASYQAAKSQYDANLARAEQSRAGILPSVGLAATAYRNRLSATGLPGEPTYGTNTATLSASQPLYRPANVASYEQGKRLADIAKETLTLAEQDLIVRVSQAYFDVLGAKDSLTFVKAQKAAVAEQLASAKRNFEVGTSTITDTREAQARYDLVIAQEIAAESDLRVKKIALDQLVGKADTDPKPLAAPVVLPPLQPGDVNAWVKRTEEGHPQIKQAQWNLDIAKLETDKARDGHKPTLDLVGQYSSSTNIGSNGSSPADSHSNVTTVGLSFNLPLFAGFAVQNRVRETLSLEEKARNDLDNAKRSVSLATRTAFFGVLSGQGQVKALEAAETSSQSALDANKLGYQVGVRINIDVLNSQSQLFQTKRDLAKARYDVLVNELRLRQAAGTLNPDDLRGANALLAK